MMETIRKAAATAAKTPGAGAPRDTGPDLRKALSAAREALGRALRAMIASNVHNGTVHRNQLENSFEATRNAIANGPTLADLEEAVANLKVAGDILANHSLNDQSELAVAREAHAAAQSALTQLRSHHEP